MGNNIDCSFEKIREIYPRTFLIPSIPSPQHLQVTSNAYIALLTYNRTSLNNIFCAPNKIYEYSCFGIPMIGNDIPGLICVVDSNNLGKCADYNSVESIIESLEYVEKNYPNISGECLRFYGEVDMDRIMASLLEDVENG